MLRIQPNQPIQQPQAGIPSDLVSLVIAVREGRAHILKTGDRYRVHIGCEDTILDSGFAFSSDEVGVSGNIAFGVRSGWLQTADIRIPLQAARIEEVLHIVNST